MDKHLTHQPSRWRTSVRGVSMCGRYLSISPLKRRRHPARKLPAKLTHDLAGIKEELNSLAPGDLGRSRAQLHGGTALDHR
jgi:hypothetical protein